MATLAIERCRRCGTKIRNQRQACPSCGWDLKEPDPNQAGDDLAEAHGHVIKKVSAKANVRICAICMATVPEEQVIEQDGQKICPTCAENIKNKAMKKTAGPPR